MKNLKKTLSLLLSLMLVLGAVAVGGMSASADSTVYEISSYADLKEFASRVNSGETGLNAKLMNDIVATGYNDWTPIGYFKSNVDNNPFIGTFDGNGRVIIGLSNSGVTDAPNYAGLFGYVGSKTEGGVTTKGIVKNVGLEGGKITGGTYVGGVVGSNDGGTITNCYNTGDVIVTVTGSASYLYAGGVAGFNDGGTITNCYNTGDVTVTVTETGSATYFYAGGVVGSNYGGTITNCYNTGDVTVTVTGSTNYISTGGVVGSNDGGTITNCYNTGDVIVTVTGSAPYLYVCGVAGINYYGGTITNCYNTGDVTVTVTETGSATYLYTGGVVGSIRGSTIINCYNMGDVTIKGTVTSFCAGGVVGSNIDVTITNCYNTGDVTVTGTANYIYAGGVAGYNGGPVSSCYSTGAVTTAMGSATYNYTGGVAGNNNGVITYCYYDKTVCGNIGAVSGADDASNVKGLTTAQMTGENALENMVFTYEAGEENPWQTRANDENSLYYPHLKGFAYDSEPTDANWPPKIEAPVTTYPLWVGGNQVTSENMGALEELDGIAVIDGGSVTFVPDDDDKGGTLYLNNATITGTKEYDFGGDFTSNILVENTEFDLTINVEGENIINGSAGEGIFLPNDNDSAALTIEGEGSIDITAVLSAILCYGSLSVDGTTVNATATEDEYGGDGIKSNYINITGSAVKAEASSPYGGGLYAYGSLNIADSTVEATGRFTGIYVDNSLVNEGLTVSGISIVTAEGGNELSGIFSRGGYHFEDGNDIVTPENFKYGKLGAGTIVLNSDDSAATTVVIGQPCTVTFNNYDGTELQSGKILKGTAPEYKGETPTRTDPSGGYTYTFSGWKDGNNNEYAPGAAFPAAESDITYTATYSSTVNEYSVEFVNDDGTELQKSDVAYGETPVYTGETPTKEATDQYTYSFAGWSPEITNVTGEATYTATFTQAPRKYEIKFVNEDGTELQSGDVAYGETPKYTGETPTKTATAEYTYEFKGWSPEISQVSGEATYTATYTETPVDYKLTWKVDGESYKNETVPFGMEISKPDDPAKEGYTFAWVDEIPATMPAEDVTIKGEFTPIEYTAKFVDEDGNTVKEVKFTVKTEKLDEPAVPEKTNYTGKWEDYTLGAADMTIKPVYTLGGETVVKAVDTGSEVTADYKETKEYNFETEYLPEGATTHVFVNGEDKGEGTSVTVEEPTEDYTVECKAFDADGNEIASSGEIKVKVKNSIFDKIKWFFSNLLKNFLDAIFGDFGKIC